MAKGMTHPTTNTHHPLRFSLATLVVAAAGVVAGAAGAGCCAPLAPAPAIARAPTCTPDSQGFSDTAGGEATPFFVPPATCRFLDVNDGDGDREVTSEDGLANIIQCNDGT